MNNTFPFPKRRRGYARVEYQAVQKDILALQAKGYPPVMIYDELKAHGKITMCRSQFCFLLRSGKQATSPVSSDESQDYSSSHTLGETA